VLGLVLAGALRGLALIFAHDEDRVVGVAEHRVGDAPHHCPAHAAQAPAAEDRQADAYLLGELDDLGGRVSGREVRTPNLAAGGRDRFGLPAEKLRASLSTSWYSIGDASSNAARTRGAREPARSVS
jgi:hypothetical protein